MKTLSICFAFIFSPLVAFAQDHYSVQPSDKYSTLIDRDGVRIRDSSFAFWSQEGLLNGDTSRVNYATFFFQQCFGGGMFDDLNGRFSDKLTWLGASAARHDQLSWGENDAVPHARDFWTKKLAPEMGQVQFMLGAAKKARNADQYGPNGTDSEDPQYLYRNGGNTFHTFDNSPGRHEIALWAGNANGVRHRNDIADMAKAIKFAHEAHTDLHFTIFGDATQIPVSGTQIEFRDATKANLKSYMENDLPGRLGGATDTFLFYASDHGGVETKLSIQSILASGLITSVDLPLGAGELQGMAYTKENVPKIVADLDWKGGDSESRLKVYLGDFLLGEFRKPDGSGPVELEFDEATFLRLYNDSSLKSLRFENNSRDSVEVRDLYFSTGGLDTSAVPEPASIVALGTGLLLVIRRRRK